MVEKIVKYLLLSMLGLSALIFVAILILDDDTIETLSGPASAKLLEIKHDVIDTVVDKSDSFVYWIRTTIHEIITFSPTDRVPSVIMRIPPPPETVERPAAQAQPLSESKPDTSAMPSSDASQAMPATTESMKSAAPKPVEAEPAPVMKSAMGNAPSVNEGAPAPVPVVPVKEQPLKGTPESAPQPPPVEQASLQSGAADAPPPPPTPEDARPGDADYQQGLKFYNGDGVTQNFGKAAQFFLKAGEAGHIGAQYNLGIMNYTGQTGGQDFSNAAKWFERAANNGHTQAQYNLGFLYYEGKGVEQNLKMAFDWINRAAEQGYGKAIKARDAFKQAMPEMFPADPGKNPAG
ncbi:MAG: hypothetical protein WD075_11340 [Rhodospirillales bacterium]